MFAPAIRPPEIEEVGCSSGGANPLGRIGTPEEFGQSGVFLASERSTTFTGVPYSGGRGVDEGALGKSGAGIIRLAIQAFTSFPKLVRSLCRIGEQPGIAFVVPNHPDAADCAAWKYAIASARVAGTHQILSHFEIRIGQKILGVNWFRAARNCPRHRINALCHPFSSQSSRPVRYGCASMRCSVL